jgi:hypothetical protein
MAPAELRRIEENKRLTDDQAEVLAEALEVHPACLRRIRGSFRGCEEALAGIEEDARAANCRARH